MPFVGIHNLFLDFIHSCWFTEISHTTATIYSSGNRNEQYSFPIGLTDEPFTTAKPVLNWE